MVYFRGLMNTTATARESSNNITGTVTTALLASNAVDPQFQLTNNQPIQQQPPSLSFLSKASAVESGRITATSTSFDFEVPCGISSLMPLGMSCRGRAEAFARSLQSRLRTLGGSQGNESSIEVTPVDNIWLNGQQQTETTKITELQPLRLQQVTTNPIVPDTADSYFDFDMEPESPGSPIDDGYTRLIETTVSTPNPDVNAPESGFVCASPYDSASSSDVQFFDPESSDTEQRSNGMEFYDCHPVKLKKSYQNYNNKFDGSSPLAIVTLPVAASPPSSSCSSPATRRMNGHVRLIDCSGGDSCSESLPPSQSTTECSNSSSNLTLSKSSNSNSTLQDAEIAGVELVPDDEVDCKSNNIKNFDTSRTKFITFNGAEEEEEELSAVIELDVPENEQQFDQDKILKEITTIEPEVKLPINDMPSSEEVLKIQQTAATVTIVKDNHTSDEEEFERPPQRVRRCSSLKSGKTPPGTPGRKKIVRFADVLGLDLADVRTFLDEVPKVPMQAYQDLIYDVTSMSPNNPIQIAPSPEKVLVPLFQQPGSLPAFLERVKDKKVCLQNAAVTDPIALTITGSVRVRNLDYHKSVHIRYSMDNWRSYSDMMANYVEDSCDGFSDKFTFLIFGNSLQIGQRIEMAIRFQTRGRQYWDNNYGQNYCFQCLPCALRNDPNCVSTSLTDNNVTVNCSGSSMPLDAGVTIVKDAIGHTQWSNTFLY
ncbi:unnamed protein product [Diamesa serratosioi]